MGGKIELAFSSATRAKLHLKGAIEAEDTHAMLLGIGNEKPVIGYGEGARAHKMICDLEAQFAVFAKGNDTTQRRVSHEEDTVALRQTDGRKESRRADLAPFAPFPGATIIETHFLRTGVGKTDIIVFIQGDSERFAESIGRFAAASEPLPEAGEAR